MKNLYFFVAHLDDFEISCLGFLFKHGADYANINIFIATDFENKTPVWKDNLEKIRNSLSFPINYHNFNYPQRSLMSSLDSLKDDFYKNIDFSNPFDLVTHDSRDCHTDHVAINMISYGLFKCSNKFVTIYSPSSRNFGPNYWIELSKVNYEVKKECVDKYNIEHEQSYSKLGYYLQSEGHYNIGKALYLENFVNDSYDFCECYKILKWVD